MSAIDLLRDVCTDLASYGAVGTVATPYDYENNPDALGTEYSDLPELLIETVTKHVREQIARDIEAERDEFTPGSDAWLLLDRSVSIARGVTS